MRVLVEQPLPSRSSLAQVGQVKIPKRFTVHICDYEDGSPDVDLVYEVRNGVPQCREVTIKATEDGHEVRRSDLVAIRVQDHLEHAIKQMALGDVTEVAAGQFRISPFASKDQRRAAWNAVQTSRKSLRGARRDLALVAQIYRENVDRNPTQAVAEYFEVAHRTAALYVWRARDADHLGAAIRGKAGEQ